MTDYGSNFCCYDYQNVSGDKKKFTNQNIKKCLIWYYISEC